MSADAPLLYDWSGAPTSAANAPITGRPGQAVNATAQGGMVQLGVDASGIARAPKIDGNGSAYVISSNPAGTSNFFYAGQPTPAAASTYGSVVMAAQSLPTPSALNPLNLDPIGALNVHSKSKQTFRTVATGVTCGTNVILLAFANASTMVMRLNDVSIYIPPAGGNSGALLASSNGLTYYPVRCEIRRIASYAGGTALSPCACDSGDTWASGATIAKLATSVTGTSALFHRQDAYATNMTGIPFYTRGDDTGKTLVLRPGEGFAVVCIDNGTVNSTVVGGGTLTATAEIVATITQAPA